MRTGIITAGMILGLGLPASAQGPFVYKPIDANKMIVQPGDAVSGMAAGATTSTFRTMTRAVANTIENNGFVKTINNLLGRRAQPQTVQGGFSPLPMPGTYTSTRYPNMFSPAMPQQQMFGRSPAIQTTTPVMNR